MSEAEVESIRQEMEQKERKAMELANQTADIIFPGEQQPESDHGIRYEQAETGTNRDRHFRRAKGWFGYTLKTNKEASRLMITTRKNDPMKVVILLNNEKLTAAPDNQRNRSRGLRNTLLSFATEVRRRQLSDTVQSGRYRMDPGYL